MSALESTFEFSSRFFGSGESGFKVPGKSKGFQHATDTGWYGCGVYFSEWPAYAMDYIKGANKLLLCQVAVR